ncbi:MAG: elongation factor P [Deltaproteobacteria bacterium]|nr:elongation factor P [Deltaproteobacteria bacterium]
MKMNATSIRVGQILEVEGDLFRVYWTHHVTPGKGNAVMQTKLKKLKTGSIIDKRFRSDERVEKVILDEKRMEWLYKDNTGYHFMDSETYEQVTLSSEVTGEDIDRFLIEGTKVDISFYEGSPVSITLPTTVNLTVTETQPGIKRATASSSLKPATLQTGLIVQVPQFVNAGDTVKVNTDTGEYVERV